MKLFLSTMIALLPVASFSEQYLCVADQAVGFKYNKISKKWLETSFNVKNQKYIISPSKNDHYAFSVKIIGDKYSDADCKEGVDKWGYLHCKGLGKDFRYNTKNHRYTITSIGGYFNAKPDSEGSVNPYIEIGKCSSF